MDLGWPFLLIVCAVALMLGPVMLLQPNKRQQRLTSLRQSALQRGICIRLDKSHGNSHSHSRKGKVIAVYSLAWPIAVKTERFCLKKQKVAHDVHFSGCWHWDDHGRPPIEWSVALKEILQSLPSDIVGVEATRHSLGFFWPENDHQITVTVIEDLLRQSQATLLNAMTLVPA